MPNDNNETLPWWVGFATSYAARDEANQAREREIQRTDAEESAREVEMLDAAVQAGIFSY